MKEKYTINTDSDITYVCFNVAIGDTDGDGFNEIIVANRESNTISLLRFKPEQSKNDR